MHIPLDSAIQLLHQTSYGALATHSTHIPGYPYASVLPFVPDARHAPLFLISTLAEHTKNLLADPRASLLVLHAEGDDVLSGARLTVVGDVAPVPPDDAVLERYLRYQPAAAHYLALGDFTLFRLTPRRLRLIAGFGKMGWLEADDWQAAQQLAPAEEHAALAELAGFDDQRQRILGLDCYGVDVERDGQRVRLAFAAAAQPAQAAAAARALLPRPTGPTPPPTSP